MSLQDVVAFINEGHTTMSVGDVLIGTQGPPLDAFFAETDGTRIAIAYKASDLNYSVNVAHVFESFEHSRGGFVVRVADSSADYVSSALTVQRTKDRASWRAGFTEVDNQDDQIKQDLKRLVSEFPPYEKEDWRSLKRFRSVRVAVLNIDDLDDIPCGVLIEQTSGNLVTLAFGEDVQADLDKFSSMTTLADASERQGQMTVMSNPVPARGHDAYDAARRALYEMAQLWYIDHGKSVYP